MADYDISRALGDQRLLGAALGDAATWTTWIAVLRAAFGLPLDDEQMKLFTHVAGNRALPKKRVRELWAIVGRRGGKSRMAAALAVFLALFVKHKLSPGERGMVLVLAASVPQARTVFSYVKAFLGESAVLSKEIASVTQYEITLRNGIIIAIHANSFRTIRGRTLCAAIFDEVAFWRDDTSAQPDVETYTAVLPSLATTNGLLVGISSPYRKTGLLHQKHRQYYGVDGDDVLVVQGGSQAFNPSLTDETIAAQRLADPTAASSEWDAEFRADLVGFLDDATVDRAVDRDRPLELPPLPSPTFYRAFVDPSGGAVGGDAYSICIAHKEDDRFVVDLVRGRRGPFDPNALTQEYAALAKEYRVGSVVGDHYAAAWVLQAWRDAGITYVVSDINVSQIYLESLPIFTRGLVELPDHPALLRELRLLERIPGRVGKDQVTHPRNAHDDLANAVCGCLRTLANYLGFDTSWNWAGGPSDDDPHGVDSWKRIRLAAYLNSGGLIRL